MNINTIKEWYNKIYSEKGRDFSPDFRAYEQFVEMARGTSILDIACGPGSLLEILPRYMQTYGCDVSEKALEVCRERCNAKNLYPVLKVCQAEQLHFPSNEFDCVTCIGSLEHFLNIDRSLNEMLRVGKEGALYIILVPNKWSVFHNKTDQQEINENFYSYFWWKNKIDDAGFVNIKVYKDQWHIIRQENKWMRLLNKIVPTIFSNSLIFTFEKPFYHVKLSGIRHD